MLVLLSSFVMVVPVSTAFAAPTNTSTLTINTQALNGTEISGYYSALYDSAGSMVGSGYSPATYTLTNGQSYTVEVDGYGSCNFDHWADNANTNPLRSISISSNTQLTAVYNCGTSSGGGGGGGGTTSTLTLNTQDLTGATITGYYSALRSSAGNVVATGYSPTTYTLTDGSTYTIEVDGYGSCNFDHWADTGSTSYLRTISISSNTQLTAVYNCGSSGGGGGGSVTVKSIDTNNNVLTGFYVEIDNPSGSVVATGYTSQTFNNLVAGASYRVQVDGYKSCSFSHWSNGANGNPMNFTASSSTTFTAVMRCNTTGVETGYGPGTITIYDHRIPASYWADCFATTCTNPLDTSCGNNCTGPGAAMWVDL
jgi:hypothetical protein